jgi:hypothetical protein
MDSSNDVYTYLLTRSMVSAPATQRCIAQLDVAARPPNLQKLSSQLDVAARPPNLQKLREALQGAEHAGGESACDASTPNILAALTAMCSARPSSTSQGRSLKDKAAAVSLAAGQGVVVAAYEEVAEAELVQEMPQVPVVLDDSRVKLASMHFATDAQRCIPQVDMVVRLPYLQKLRDTLQGTEPAFTKSACEVDQPNLLAALTASCSAGPSGISEGHRLTDKVTAVAQEHDIEALLAAGEGGEAAAVGEVVHLAPAPSSPCPKRPLAIDDDLLATPSRRAKAPRSLSMSGEKPSQDHGLTAAETLLVASLRGLRPATLQDGEDVLVQARALAHGRVATSDGHGQVWVKVERRQWCGVCWTVFCIKGQVMAEPPVQLLSSRSLDYKHGVSLLSMSQAFHELAKVVATLTASELGLQGRTLFWSLLPLVQQWLDTSPDL